MNTSVSYYSSIGKRDRNEDSVKIVDTENGLLAMIADGLGGMSCGKLASELVLKELVSNIDFSIFSESQMTQAAYRANAAVRAQYNDNINEMCSTLAALWIFNKKAMICYVGDSRIYQIRNNKIKYQSVDHSVSQLAVILGEITADQIRGHKDRNKLLRSIGADETIKPQIDVLRVKSGDAFLLCSDGFWEQITEQDIIKLRKNCTQPSEWLSNMKRYIEDAVDDNNSAIAIFVK